MNSTISTATSATASPVAANTDLAALPVYTLDPCCHDFPPMQHDEFTALKDSIALNGQKEPILVWQGKVVDGRHRYQACIDLGLAPLVHVLDAATTYEVVKSTAYLKNVNRRHLTTGQRAMLAAPLATRSPGQTTNDKAAAGNKALGLTQLDAGKLFAVSRDAVQKAAQILKDADPALIEEVRTGSCNLNSAVESLKSKSAKGVRAFLTPAERAALKLAAGVKAQLSEESRTKRLTKQAAISQKNMALPTGIKHGVVLADPPWDYGMPNTRSGTTSKVLPHNAYPTMPMDDICAMPVADMLADDAMLFLWCPASLLPEGLRVMQSWGFDQFVTSWVWHKTGGKLTCAGGTAVARHELVLVGKRRNGLSTAGTAVRESSVFEAPVTTHSTKPTTVHERIEKLYPGVQNRIELFARTPRTGWSVFGNQAAGTPAVVVDANVTVAVTVPEKDCANDDVMVIKA
jgi:N6-adenosine-specific RNA methylase IME4/ParB-like chromosome segregation protein Spo0J